MNVVWIDSERKSVFDGPISFSPQYKIWTNILDYLRSIYKREEISENNFRDLDLSVKRLLCTSVRLAIIRLNRLKHDTFSFPARGSFETTLVISSLWGLTLWFWTVRGLTLSRRSLWLIALTRGGFELLAVCFSSKGHALGRCVCRCCTSTDMLQASIARVTEMLSMGLTVVGFQLVWAHDFWDWLRQYPSGIACYTEINAEPGFVA
jgi:hypothetical protein